MVSAEPSDLVVRLAIGIGTGSMALTFAMLAGILAMRGLFHRMELRRQNFLSVWRPLFVQALYDPPTELPRLSEEEKYLFLTLFNQYHSIVKGEGKKRLNAFADAANIRRFVLRTLINGSSRRRLAATHAAGLFREPIAFKYLVKEVASENTAFSLAAASAMVNIDAARAVKKLIPLFARRDDWPASACERLLSEAGQGTVSGPLKDAVMGAVEADAPALIRLLNTAGEETANECIRYWLGRTRSGEVISICLQMIKDPRQRNLAHGYLDHPIWYVRMQAVSALGRVGNRDDVEGIVRMLTDKEWWVRYRAAKTLAEMPHLAPKKFDEIRNAQTDRYARDVLDYVAAVTGK